MKKRITSKAFLLCFLLFLPTLCAKTPVRRLNVQIIADQSTVDHRIKQNIHTVTAKIFSTYSTTFHFTYKQDLPIKIRIFDNATSFKKYQKKVSQTSKSNNGFYSFRLKEVVLWKNKTPTKMLAVIYHESSHLILRKRISKCPKWLNEGLAEYFENTELADRSVIVKIQRQKDARTKQWARSKQIMSLKKYLRLSNKEWKKLNADPAHTASTIAWSLVYYLMSSETGKHTITQVLHALEQGNYKTFSSVKTMGKFYPGGLTKLEHDWHRWILAKQRKPHKL